MSCLALLAVFGCKVGPTFTRPAVPVADNWLEKDDPRLATQAAVEARWWRAFNDPTLDRLIELAYGQNLPLQIAGLRIFEARARLAIATGRQYPQVQVLFGSLNAIGLSQRAANVTSFSRHFLDYQVGFDVSWEADLWGKYGRGVQAQAASLLASEADYRAAIVSLTAEVARAYVVLRTSERLIELARQNADIQEQGLNIAESRFRNGATSELDVTQARTQWEGTRATIPQLQAGLQQARNALCTLLGQPTGTLDSLLAGQTGIPTAPATVAVGLPAEMLRRRPDVHSAELQAAAQCALIGVAKAELYPSFTLAGVIGLQASTASSSSNPFSPDAAFYSAGPSILYPLLNYGRITNNVRVEDARFQQLLVNYRQTVLAAAQEVEDALIGFLTAEDAVLLQQRSVDAAEKSVQLATTQYREGATDFQRVLDAQRALLQQQNALAQSRSSVATSLIAAYKALGGGWEPRQGQPIVRPEVQEEMRQRTNWGDMLSEPSAPGPVTNPQPGKP